MPKHTLYLLLNLGALFFPLVLSFDKKVHFYKRWLAVLPAIFCVLLVFVPWDIGFTKAGIWGFNTRYTTGYTFSVLPIEEVFFFITVPYACLFIYATLNAYWPAPVYTNLGKWVYQVLFIAVLCAGVWQFQRAYTAVSMLCLAAALLLHWALFRYQLTSHFFRAYVVHLVPFAIMNGVLTYLPVVWYNNTENLSLRAGSIPVEDFFYSMAMFLLAVTVYELIQRKMQYKLPVATNSTGLRVDG